MKRPGLERREFLGALMAAPLLIQETRERAITVEILYRSPDGHPNALEDTPEGLWVGEQTTDAAYLLDWKTGKALRRVETESSNTSGLAFGGGFLWMAANGPAVGRPSRPNDAKTGEILKVDPATGRTLARHPVPGGGGVHGLLWARESLWVTTLKNRSITQLDTYGKVLHSFPVTLDRAHGLGWDGAALWCMFSNDRVIQRLDPKDGSILQTVRLKPEDPDPHGMAWFRGALYYTDAGISPGAVASGSKFAGSICRVRL